MESSSDPLPEREVRNSPAGGVEALPNLHSVATSNTSALEAETSAVESRSRDGSRVRDYKEFVEVTASVAMNLRPQQMLDFVRRGRRLSAQQRAAVEAQNTGESVDDAFDRLQGNFATPRRAFEGSFKGGAAFVYGTLNGGGASLAHSFGYYCCIFDDSLVTQWDPVFLPGNSLLVYVDSGNVDLAAVGREAGPYSHRSDVAILKDRSAIDGWAADWEALLCREDSFVEVITSSPVEAQSVSAVRLPKYDYERLWDFITEATLTPVSRVEGEAFSAVLSVVGSLGVPLEMVE